MRWTERSVWADARVDSRLCNAYGWPGRRIVLAAFGHGIDARQLGRFTRMNTDAFLLFALIGGIRACVCCVVCADSAAALEVFYRPPFPEAPPACM